MQNGTHFGTPEIPLTARQQEREMPQHGCSGRHTPPDTPKHSRGTKKRGDPQPQGPEIPNKPVRRRQQRASEHTHPNNKPGPPPNKDTNHNRTAKQKKRPHPPTTTNDSENRPDRDSDPAHDPQSHRTRH